MNHVSVNKLMDGLYVSTEAQKLSNFAIKDAIFHTKNVLFGYVGRYKFKDRIEKI